MFPEGPASLALPRIGQILSGKYELLRLLGEGGMAFVYEATHLRLKQRVAIKLLAPDMARDPELRARFEHEARAVAKLRTPHVARVMDVDVTNDDLPFIVMEFLEGHDVEAELGKRGRIPLDEAVDWMLQAAAAMLEAHDTGIVHRDLKPANLFLAREGPDQIVKVLDFGISKVVGDATRLTAAGAVMGTVLYMSPEQIRASKDVDQRADVWSLGVILFELVAGQPPWVGNSHQIAAAIVGQTAPDIRQYAPVPEVFATILSRLLERDAGMRVQSMTEVILALGPYARAESLGGTLASQIALGTTGARMRAISGREGRVVKSVTMPMMPGPSNHPQTPRMAITPMQTAPPAIAPTPAPRASDPSLHPKRGHGLFAFAVFLGLVGAVGVTLTVLWYWQRPRLRPPEIAHPPPPAETVLHDAAVSPATTTSDAPPPPPTGTATVPRKSGTH